MCTMQVSKRTFVCHLWICLLASTARLVAMAGVLIATGTAAIAQEQRIAALVNEAVISRRDVENRLDLVIGLSTLANTPEVRHRLLPQILQTLVDEHLKMQEAEALHFAVSDEDVANAIALIEVRNSLPRGGFEQLITERHLNRTTLIEQMHAEVAWYKVVQRTIRPQAKVGEDEIEAVLQDLRATAGRPQNQLTEIFLSVDSPGQEDDVRILAERLIEQIRAGADFKAIARQFSQTASAATDGDLGWTYQGQLAPEVEDVLTRLQPGQLSTPIRTLSGYTILLLRARRGGRLSEEVRFTLSQIFMPVTGPNAIPPQTRSELVDAARKASSCEAFNALARKTRAPQSGSLGQVRVSDLSPDLRTTILPLALHTASAPVPVEDGIVVLMVCERIEPPLPDLPSREEIAQRLEIEKATRIQHHRLRDLRRAAFIEIRL